MNITKLIEEREAEFEKKFLTTERKWKMSANGRFDYSPDEILAFQSTTIRMILEAVEGQYEQTNKDIYKIRAEYLAWSLRINQESVAGKKRAENAKYAMDSIRQCKEVFTTQRAFIQEGLANLMK